MSTRLAFKLVHELTPECDPAYYLPTSTKFPKDHLFQVANKILIYFGFLAPAVGIEPTTN